MLNRVFYKAFFSICLIGTISGCSQKVNIQKEFTVIKSQIQLISDSTDLQIGKQQFPRTLQNGKLKFVGSGDWTSGFYPGLLWYLYEYTEEQHWKDQAIKYTESLKKEQFNTSTHDLGFMMYCSYGNGYRLTNNPEYKNIIIQSAKSLTKRYNPKTKTIRSWDFSGPDKSWKFPVIIDNMMNLELLFEATKLSGDSTFYNIAITHANTTLKNHFRDDFSSYHVVDYDPETGEVRHKHTLQGYSHASAWARGQAWGFYGFLHCYKQTGNSEYLKAANSIYKYIFENPQLPRDLVPYWDYNDPNIPNAPKDASAAAITASALYDMSDLTRDMKYKKLADKIVSNLTKHYRSPIGKNSGFILLHSTGHLPGKSEIDVPLNYADYYYVEALLKSKKTS
ncbi:glycosyl hydrolase family 88 [Pseudopedobacter saltans DSM 12145]|uniref:Glycosyl hydrolase family 88 n=1 Tax=Pseudopedobacter saltans (strain ATCC 51119 / DSM 12145 / JCM 21818 / CCUG 39354 / LMG 10337 / NBRC 100064 / NCIMB 13643) TaxID=762903 RepID=F0SA47_PSESL|nr:glycoside hydrolase family 88 protein [Pseudopedobacter saltans]ADY53611.1 glycosyl hydrolase family 88 [Pseudopedobacter saltans DSM 12145]